MAFAQLLPPGPAGSAEDFHTGLGLGEGRSLPRPYLACNFVASLDGKATAAGRTAPLSDPADRRVFHLLRTQVDAILVGTGTLRVERYGPLIKNAELAAIRAAEGRPAQPLAVMVSRTGDLPSDIPLFTDPASRVAAYVPSPRASAPAGVAATVHMHGTGGQAPRLGEVLCSLREEHGVGTVLCEGGPALFNSLLAEDLVDEFFLTLAPVLIGGGEFPVTVGAALAAPRAMRLTRALAADGQLFLRYARD
jgi:riboflavin-specific deaminase-like protein